MVSFSVIIKNSNAEFTWVCTRLMHRLNDQDDCFDFGMNYDDNQQIDAILRQTGPMRASLWSYGRVGSCVDAPNKEIMNTAGMHYISFVVPDANKHIAPASELFVFREAKGYYGLSLLERLR